MTDEEDWKSEDTTQTSSDPSKRRERRIGPYKLLRELGHGGMGTVFLAARADEQYHKRVALKVVRGVDSEEVVRHFRRERQILASLDHPNIAKLLDGGTTDDGLPYFVMEHVEGQPIDVYCDRHSLSTVERLKLFRSVCSAVQYAHRNLVVHRDIKPANILVTSEGEVRLLDFGIAKLLNPGLLGEAPTVTRRALTPDYASPEQARGEPITTATDVYSLGIVLFELLTGHRAYRLKSRQPLEVLRAVVEEEPERPSTAVGRTEELATTVTPESVSRCREGTPERLRRKLQGDLDNIVLLALRKEPQNRYPSVEAFSEDLRRHVEGLPVLARKGTLAYRAGKFVKRHALGVTSAAALALLIVGFGISMAVQSARVSRALEKVEQERSKAEKVSSFLVDLFKVSDPSEARGNTITAREVLDKGAERIGAELKDQPEVRATLMSTMGSVYQSLGLYDRATPLLKDALAMRRQVLGNDDPDVATSLNSLGVLLWQTGDYVSAETLHREALALRRQLYGNDHNDVASSLNNLANVVHHKGDLAGAEALFREAIAIRRKLFGNDHPGLARNLSNLANVLNEKGDYAGAGALFREALAIRRRLLGSDHPDVAGNLHNLANVLNEKGDHAGAEALFREALALERKLFGDEHPLVAESLNGLADCLSAQQRFTEAEPFCREGLRVRRKALPPGHPEIAPSLVGLGQILLKKGAPKGAEPLLREALEIRKKALPAGHPDIADSESALGGFLTALKRLDEAEALLLRSYPVLKTKRGERSRSTREALERLVALYEASGRPEKTREYAALLSNATLPEATAR